MELLDTYRKLFSRCLNNSELQKQSDFVYVSLVIELLLCEYAEAKKIYCKCCHSYKCEECVKTINVIDTILKEGYCTLSMHLVLYQLVSSIPLIKPEVDYSKFPWFQFD